MSAESIPWVKRARLLAWITILYNLIEAAACAWFGVQEETLSLLGFGGDSLLEAGSGGIVLWRFAGEGAGYSAEHAQERRAHRVIGALFLLFALSLAVGAVLKWGSGPHEGSAWPAVVISLISLAVMGFLYSAKKKTAKALNSPALRADAFATLSCMWLSALLLVGSAVLQATHYVVFDIITSLIIAWLLAKEGWEGWSGEEGHGHG